MIIQNKEEFQKAKQEFIEQFKEQFKETTLSRDQIVFLFYLQRNLGVLSNACKAYNISRTAIYKWKKKSVEFAQAFDEVTEYTTDKVEASLLEQILKDKNTQATIFYLKSKGKQSGYGDHIHVEHSGNISNQSVEGMSDEQLARIARGEELFPEVAAEESIPTDSASSDNGA